MTIPFGLWVALAVIGALGFILLGTALLVKKFYRKVEQGDALINNKIGTTAVAFTGGLVLPIIHRAEIMDISLKTIEIDRRGKDGLICSDNIRADIKVTFFVRVNKTEEDVLKVAQAIGCSRASDKRTLEELFIAKFSEALKTVGYNMKFVDLYDKRDAFKDRIIEVIGTDLNGFVLEDAAIDFLEQTPIESLDPDNILDAEGIRAIREITAAKHIETKNYEAHREEEIERRETERIERVLVMKKTQEEAQAKQQREIATIKARETAEARKVTAEEHRRAEEARIAAEEGIQVANENKSRQVELAAKNRERAVLVETERVEKDRAVEAIQRERETELLRIEKEKALEVERKEIQDVIRARVAVEKTVAEEEERIKDVRAIKEADRKKTVAVTAATAEAEMRLVKDIKAAEAQEKASTHVAKQKLIIAEAELEAADKEASAEIRRAEGVQATHAASGLAEARVKEADALAEEKQGMAQVRVKEADAEAVRKMGNAEADVLRGNMLAKAKGDEEQGMADVRVKESEAVAIEKRGMAEATAIKEKLTAEAQGLNEKAEAMKALDEAGRGHEEFRLELEKEKTVELESIEANREIAEYQANVLGEAFKNTKIDIVGGDGEFFDRFVKAVGMGKSVDGFFNKSQTANTAFSDYLSGDKSLPGDVKDVLSRPALSAGDLQSLTVSALLGRLAAGGSKEQQGAMATLIDKAKELGLEDLPLDRLLK
jgi:uncharacterized membrane protein YqiK